MGKTPNGKVWLCSCPELPSDYSNTYWFEGLREQLKYFSYKAKHEFTKYTYLRKEDAIQVNIHVDKIHECNYLYYQNDADNQGKYYFCFITEKEYINENTTKIYIMTDVIQTYWNDFELRDSYVDRMHVARWKTLNDGSVVPTDEYEPEGLEYGEHVHDKDMPLYTMKDQFVAVCSNPLGSIPNRKQWSSDGKPAEGGGSGGGDRPTCSGDWEKGIVSPALFRFTKGKEAFSPYKIWTAGSYVIAYGMTPQGEPQEFKDLEGKQPVREEEGARVSYECMNKYYGNSKLFNGRSTVEFFKNEFHVDSQHKFDALIDLFYTTGQESLRTGELHDALRDHPNDESIIRPIWERWWANYEHLKTRRKEECDIYFGKGYGSDPINMYDNRGVIVGYVQTNNGNGWLPECTPDPIDPGGDTFEAQGVKWQYPLRNKTGTVTSLFGSRKDPHTGQPSFHYGLDIGANYGTPVYATRDGLVIFSGNAGTAGLMVEISHTDINMHTKFMHNSRLAVSKGQVVKAGQVIAYVGSTGSSTGNHCHYQLEIAPYGKPYARNPMPQAYPGMVM